MWFGKLNGGNFRFFAGFFNVVDFHGIFGFGLAGAIVCWIRVVDVVHLKDSLVSVPRLPLFELVFSLDL